MIQFKRSTQSETQGVVVSTVTQLTFNQRDEGSNPSDPTENKGTGRLAAKIPLS